jgi:hypothetical protein
MTILSVTTSMDGKMPLTWMQAPIDNRSHHILSLGDAAPGKMIGHVFTSTGNTNALP